MIDQIVEALSQALDIAMREQLKQTLRSNIKVCKATVSKVNALASVRTDLKTNTITFHRKD